MERKLASLQYITSIEEIENADNLEKARVMGWDVVVKKGEFKPNQLVVFVEPDAVLPEEPWAEFMRPRKFRIKTIKLRGVLSQGLVFPLSILPESVIRDAEAMGPHGPVGLREGADVTEELGITKYEPPLHDGGAKQGQSAGAFPHYVPKTDETRLQSALPVLEELKGHPYVITLKCDGTSGTFVAYEDKFFACSRNWAKKEDDTNMFWAMVRKYNLQEKLMAKQGFAVQGELIGPGIQGNKMGLPEIDLLVFTVYDVEKKRRLEHDDLVAFCDELELKRVPVIEEGKSFNYTLEYLLEKAEGKYEGTKNHREGLVIRPKHNIFSKELYGPLSFKVLCNSFLLREK